MSTEYFVSLIQHYLAPRVRVCPICDLSVVPSSTFPKHPMYLVTNSNSKVTSLLPSDAQFPFPHLSDQLDQGFRFARLILYKGNRAPSQERWTVCAGGHWLRFVFKTVLLGLVHLSSWPLAYHAQDLDFTTSTKIKTKPVICVHHCGLQRCKRPH